ncbi:hypothetical protein G184_gp32 [Erwinia phage ENT90]|uniref:Uncharacterized protein n=1 Tax=Erwinia phage ENT90 TaxID=947843 RepID=F1BUT5_9CAUD|nr:hypothetical protein G184_gp32 [Erwinia phage ENT90]ADX32431.1 hypothetical protein [Erwinia phage ENT90]
MLHFINGKLTLVRQRLPLPAEKQFHHRTAYRQRQLAVGVVQLNIQLVSLKAPVIGKRQRQQPVAQVRGHVLCVYRQPEIRGKACACLYRQAADNRHDNSPPAEEITLPAADLMLAATDESCPGRFPAPLISPSACFFRSPNIAVKDSSTRNRLRVKVIFRALPSL